MTKGNNVFALFTNPPRANASFSNSKVKKSAIITKGRKNNMGTIFLVLKMGRFIGPAFFVASTQLTIITKAISYDTSTIFLMPSLMYSKVSFYWFVLLGGLDRTQQH